MKKHVIANTLSRKRESNSQPWDWKSHALPIELFLHARFFTEGHTFTWFNRRSLHSVTFNRLRLLVTHNPNSYPRNGGRAFLHGFTLHVIQGGVDWIRTSANWIDRILFDLYQFVFNLCLGFPTLWPTELQHHIVVRGRFELPTRGFSVHCSTDWATAPFVLRHLTPPRYKSYP